MKFAKLLEENTAEITELWLEKTIMTYPKDSFGFLKGQKNQFANPVGNTHAVTLKKLVELLVLCDESTDFRPVLTEVVKIRAIQDFSPSAAVSFILFLKDVVREVLKKEIKRLSSASKDLTHFDAQVDQMLLQSIDVYSVLREKLYKIRIDEVKRNVASLIRQTGFFDEEMDT